MMENIDQVTRASPTRPRREQRNAAREPEPTEAEIQAFVGWNAGFYLDTWNVWAVKLGGWAQAMGFNFAAFLFPELWLLYRKMYWIALFICGALAILILVLPRFADPLIVTLKLASPDLIVHVGLGRLLLMLVCGSLGNVWYLAHARRKISEVRAMGLDGESHLKELARRGGTCFNAGIFGCYLPYLVAKIVAYVIHGA